MRHRFHPPGVEPNCTLRAAIGEAEFNNQGDSIVFDPARVGTITLSVGALEIANDTTSNDPLTIKGPGARKFAVSGNDASWVFEIDASADVTIEELTINGGRSSNINGGGGIYSNGSLELTNSTVSGNTATDTFTARGSGIFNDEAGILEPTNSTVSGNTVSGGTANTNSGGGDGRSTGTGASRAGGGARGVHGPPAAALSPRIKSLALASAWPGPPMRGGTSSSSRRSARVRVLAHPAHSKAARRPDPCTGRSAPDPDFAA